MKMKILIVDDDTSLRSALTIMLQDAGYNTCEASDGIESLTVFDQEKPDLVVLDVMMPKLDGFATCAVMRKVSPHIPILFLSAKGDIVDKTSGFHSGADDYLTKPFSNEELLLRIEALLRRAGSTAMGTGNIIETEHLHIDISRHEVLIGNRDVKLTPKEFGIVALLGSTPGKVYANDEIIEKVWGADYRGTSISIPVYIRHIREKIEENPAEPELLRTVGSYGYRLD